MDCNVGKKGNNKLTLIISGGQANSDNTGNGAIFIYNKWTKLKIGKVLNAPNSILSISYETIKPLEDFTDYIYGVDWEALNPISVYNTTITKNQIIDLSSVPKNAVMQICIRDGSSILKQVIITLS